MAAVHTTQRRYERQAIAGWSWDLERSADETHGGWRYGGDGGGDESHGMVGLASEMMRGLGEVSG